MVSVKIAIIPGSINTYAVNPGTTIRDVLALGNVSVTGKTVKINNVDADLNAAVSDGATITVSAKIQGNA